MMLDKLLIFWYKFQFVAQIYYFLTLKISSKLPKNIVRVYSSFAEIKNVLKDGKLYVSDKLFGFRSDFLIHPGVIQHRLDTKQLIGDCDEHAIYWCAAIKKSKLAKRVWFAYFSFKTYQPNTNNWKYSAHAVCVFRGLNNKYYWCDYGWPKEIQNIADFQISYCEMKKCTPIVGCLWSVNDIDTHDTPKFGAYTRVLPGEKIKL